MPLDYKEYNDAFTITKEVSNTIRTVRMLLLVKHCLLGRNKKETRILNVGSGSCDTCKDFVNFFLPLCNEIVLCDINPLYYNDYLKSCTMV